MGEVYMLPRNSIAYLYKFKKPHSCGGEFCWASRRVTRGSQTPVTCEKCGKELTGTKGD